MKAFANFDFDSLREPILSEFPEFDFEDFCHNPVSFYIWGARKLCESDNLGVRNAAEFIFLNRVEIIEKFNSNLLKAEENQPLDENSSNFVVLIAGQHPPQVDESGKQFINMEQARRVDAAFMQIGRLLIQNSNTRFSLVMTGGKNCNDTGSIPTFAEPEKSLAAFTEDYILSIPAYKELVDQKIVGLIGEEFMNEATDFSVYGSADECAHFSAFLQTDLDPFQKIFVACSPGQAMQYFLLSANNGFITEFVISQLDISEHGSLSNDFIAISQIFEQMLTDGGDITAIRFVFPFAMGSRLLRAAKADLDKFLQYSLFQRYFVSHVEILKRVVEGENIESYGFYNVFRSSQQPAIDRLEMLYKLAEEAQKKLDLM